MVDRDRSIISQVAAKIASDLAIHNVSLDAFAEKFVGVNNILMELIYDTVQSQPTQSASTNAGVQYAEQAFGAKAEFNIVVRGKQHGEIPSWLLDACKRDGITEVYDNRDGLAENPKRPWFKAVKDKEKAYWPPRGK